MATLEELYQRACDEMAHCQIPALSAESRRIWILIGMWFDTPWHCMQEPGFSFVDRIANPWQYQPESEEEHRIWNELTAPHNYRAVSGYIEGLKGQLSEYNELWHAVILDAARQRWRRECGVPPNKGGQRRARFHL